MAEIEFTPISYYRAMKKNTPQQYAQRLWWCFSTASAKMVDETLTLVEDDVFNNYATVIAYNIKYSDKQFADTKYVTALQRFYKPISKMQVYDDFICRHYPTKRQGIDIFKIWHPSQREIRLREIDDDIEDSEQTLDGFVSRNMLYDLKDGEYEIY
ncbi:Hypothetical predicted protein [Paramuricea clavata]|uniref:Uncharacterized protein n=1 Tax=Paramuricea clavata TaxID=317549 RepID=A0A7D9HE63_PARCT|nr:Hypothetical predicted protein [Paramuricea clavata]